MEFCQALDVYSLGESLVRPCFFRCILFGFLQFRLFGVKEILLFQKKEETMAKLLDRFKLLTF